MASHYKGAIRCWNVLAEHRQPFYKSTSFSIWDHSLVLPKYQVDAHSDLLLLTILMFHLSKKKSTIGSRAFLVAATKIWNPPTDDAVSASYVDWFPHQLKTNFYDSFCCWHFSGPCSSLDYLAH